ncbi:MAG: hypothetical protein ABI867_41905 [Kofleriaceae bacterium]
MRITLASLVLASSFVPSLAIADDVERNPNDPGKVTRIKKGVWEASASALGVLSSATEGDTTSTRFSTDGALTISRFVRDNVSIGVSVLGSYATVGGNDFSVQGGAALVSNLHLRLGLGAFFRPGIAIGGLFGSHNTPLMSGLSQQDTEVGFIARLQLPIAYFTSKRFNIHAGPQLNFTAGSITPEGKDPISFTRLAGGFAIGAGYVF